MAQWLTSEKYGNGSDGAYAPETGTDAPVDSSCSGTATETALTATNASFAANNIILIHQSRGTGVGQWELNVIESYTAGTITTKYALAYTYTDSGASQAQVLVLKQYSSALIDTGVTLTAKAWGGDVGGKLGFMCNGITTITGNIVGSAKGYLGASTRSGVQHTIGYQGEGTVATRDTQSSNENGNGGGGGRVIDDWGGGGGGGNGAVGSNGAAGSDAGEDGGDGGTAAGAADLTTSAFGGGGGSGTHEAGDTGGGGGIGGGGIFIFSKTVTITGAITNSGGIGTNGTGTDGGGGGGGAGGSILIKGQEITLGTSLVTTAAGAGGSATGGSATNGGAGAVGRIAVYYGSTITGTTTPTYDETQDSDLISSTGGSFLYNMI